MSLKTKFLISFQHSGRRWFCNVLGHYDQYLLNMDPSGTWVRQQNPLRTYGTNKRWNIVPSHCNNGIGNNILVPRFYKYRQAVILIRHPAKVIYSVYRGRKAKNPEFNMSPELFVNDHILEYFISYANKVYSCIGQNNKKFISYNRLFTEQFSDEKGEWEKVIRFFFGSVDRGLLDKAISNNIASDQYADGVKRYNRAEPFELGRLTDMEKTIDKFIEPELRCRLDKKIYKYFKDEIYL